MRATNICSEFKSRGGFTLDDVLFLAAERFTDSKMELQVKAALKLVSGGKQNITVKSLVIYLLKAGLFEPPNSDLVSGNVFKLNLDEIGNFIDYCFGLHPASASQILKPETELNIDIIVRE